MKLVHFLIPLKKEDYQEYKDVCPVVTLGYGRIGNEHTITANGLEDYFIESFEVKKGRLPLMGSLRGNDFSFEFEVLGTITLEVNIKVGNCTYSFELEINE